ncbi:3421_t:CDS:1 [Funneliformis mosseae]|uniref:3421_t:CDS:1 n=1 Tax=Funneliformis mosseae TaxID=27381 RepID=A0A9N9GUY4_FUNMO|nr:3421_t:CDS:1 [Funneliformis mosseae]
MTSESYEQKSRLSPYVRKINFVNDNRRRKKKPPKLCLDCKETDNYVELFSNKVNRIEEIGDNLYDNIQKKKTENCSIYNAKFTLNNVPCEIEYDLSHFTLQELDKLANLATENFNDDNINPIPTSLNENEQFILNNVPCEPLKLCSMCKETNDCFNLFSSKVNKIEKIVDNLHECISKRNEKLSKYTAQFSLNNVPCELEYDLSNFTFEELQKLVNFTTQDQRC